MKKHPHCILIADDEEGIRLFLRDALSKEDYDLITVADGQEAVDATRQHHITVAIMDIKMPHKNGLEALEEMRAIDERIIPIILTAYGRETMAIDGLQGRAGASYLTKPVAIDTLREAVARACEQYECLYAQTDDGAEGYDQFNEIIGTSARIMDMKSVLKKVVMSDVTVLLCGESGTGKELVAQAIHHTSARSAGPFIGFNCSAIPDTLLESELFGYEKGAFTGAEQAKPGKFELAHTGSIFLDEVSDMNLLTQAKLLRVVQERTFERLGGTRPIHVDVRIIAATNKDLREEVRAKRFREDLYYRINVIPIMLPALRERKEDIPLLLDYMMRKFCIRLNKKIEHISVEAMEALMSYHWPGNVREFENVLQRALLLEEGALLTRQHLPHAVQEAITSVPEALSDIDFSRPLADVTRDVIDIVERELIVEALKEAGGNRVQAARLLKISRKSLYNKIAKYNFPE